MRAPLILITLTVAAAARAEEPPERLTIDDAVRIARANHPAVAAARAGVQAAGARVQQGWAPFSPSLLGTFAWNPQTANFAASPAFNRVIGSGSGRPTPPDSAEMFSYWTAQAGLYWTLFDWGRTWFGWRSQVAGRVAAEESVEATLLQVALDARAAFYGALAADQLVAVAEESVATQRKHLGQMQGFFEVGTRTRVDVAQARADLAGAQLALVRARGGRDAAYATLHAALGLEQWQPIRLVEPGPPPPGDEVADIEAAVAARPEPRQLAAQARAAGDLGRSFRGAYLPSLLLTLGPSFAGVTPQSMTPNFQLTLQIGYPLLGMNPVLVHGQVGEQEANRLALLEQARAARNGIRLEAAQARATLVAARQAVTAAEELLAAASERRTLANGRFEAGLGTVLDLSDAELAYVNARAQVVQAQFDLGVARARLDKAMGR